MFDKKQLRHTPSQSDGIDYLTEIRYRKEGAKFIQSSVKELGLTYDTMATGCVFFHRFFMHHSFEKFNRWVMSSACLFLAGKVEETPKLSKDVVRTAKNLLNSDQFKSYGSAPLDEMLLYEKILLQTIKFDFNITHPYKFILKYAKQFRGDKKRKEEVVQMAWNFCNESFCTPLALFYPPDCIAGALLGLSAKRCNFPIRISPELIQDELFDTPWWSYFIESPITVNEVDEIQDIMIRLSEEKADLYEDEVDVTTSDSPPHTFNKSPQLEKNGVPPPPPRHSTIVPIDPTPPPAPPKRSSDSSLVYPKRRSESQNSLSKDRQLLRSSSHEKDHVQRRSLTAHPPPPPYDRKPLAESASRHSRRSHQEVIPGLYDPSKGFS